MLTAEEKKLIDGLLETVQKIQADYEAGLITEKEYQEVSDLLEEAEAKILAISNQE